MQVTGTTFINHAIRAKLGLSLQEYTVMQLLSDCADKSTDPRFVSVEMIGVQWDNISEMVLTLYEKGFVHNFIPTEKWKFEFVKPKKVTKKTKKEFVPPTKQDVQDYFKLKGYTIYSADKAFDYYNEADWTDRNGDKVLNWKQKMIANWMKPENKIKENEGSASYNFFGK